jgi:hypothetical protein
MSSKCEHGDKGPPGEKFKFDFVFTLMMSSNIFVLYTVYYQSARPDTYFWYILSYTALRQYIGHFGETIMSALGTFCIGKKILGTCHFAEVPDREFTKGDNCLWLVLSV